jgi:hypothetical protein
MVTNVIHYGKKMEELSNDERTLLTMDTLCLLGHSIVDNPSVSFFGDDMKKKIGSIVKQRSELSIKLLNLDIEDFSSVNEMMEYIETTRYGIRNFQKDLVENTKRIEQMERLSTLN